MQRTVVYRLLLLLALLMGGVSGAVLAPGSSGPHERTIDITLPLAEGAQFRDDYHAARGDGSRAHRATDLFAAAGTRVYAAEGGTISWMPGRHYSAGYALQIRGRDGRTYAYYHLGPHHGSPAQAYAPGLSLGQTVSRGQHIGYVGDSGNAVGGAPHLHFEIHDDGVTDPYGTNRVNPYRSLAAAKQRGDFPRAGGGPSRGGGSSGGARQGDVLRLGDRGDAVAAWQRQLNRVRSSQIATDGIFGPQTDQATRDFQRTAGITVDGIVGPQSRSALAGGSPGSTTPVRSGSGSSLLRLGDRGPETSAWQRQLNEVRRSSILVDGIFGPQTDGATREFQRSAGIVVDGIVGPQTRAAIRR